MTVRYSDPVGVLFTFTCYGTWLHGDKRGSVDKKRAGYEWPSVIADPVKVAATRRKLVGPPYEMDAKARAVVDATIREVCNHRGWALIALNVRTNHLHAVIWAPCDPEKVMGDLKAWCTRRLRERGLAAKDARLWTQGGSTRYLWSAEDRAAAIDYVANRQGPELPMEH